jgi:mono/diheme cytochrome c family protein
LALAALALLTLALSACGRNMYDQPKAKAFQASPFFADGSAMRPLPAGTVSRERGGLDPAFVTGQDANGLLTDSPIPVTLDTLKRGQQRFDIYCAPCHNYNGDGAGEIVQRGFPQPPSFTSTQRLLDQPVGYYFTVMTNGFGRMYSYASRIPPEDRWAIADYVKALQLSQNASEDDVPADVLAQLKQAGGGAP